MSACGWLVWKERQEPHQWLARCNRGCVGSIRCNDSVTATEHVKKVRCKSLAESGSYPSSKDQT